MRNNSGMASEATLLVGTRKGLFMIESSNNRATWSDPEMSHEGWYVLDAMRDVRTGRIWACCHNDFFGPKLSYSDDGGESWVDIGDGKLPTRFGFPMAAHPSRSGMIWIAPQQSDGQRFMIDGKMCVYKSSDGGETWQDKRAGLPQSGAFVSVLREGLGVDRCDPCGVYVGTTGGALFGSTDEGETWNTIASFLPPISSVTAF
jgi:photosystem II stability/assembly factor-like uncharacterized protein